jgi:hypothetical protein
MMIMRTDWMKMGYRYPLVGRTKSLRWVMSLGVVVEGEYATEADEQQEESPLLREDAVVDEEEYEEVKV